jgi:TonB family protein
MMKTFRFFSLSLPVLASIILFTANISYGHDVESPTGKVISQLNLIPNISVIKQVNPIYPSLARAALISTTFIVEVAVDRSGKVTSVKALSGHPMLKESSINAVWQWEFTPISLGDAQEKIVGTITFDYVIPRVREELERAKLKAERNPDSPEALFELANVYQSSGWVAEAVKNYEEVIRLKTDYDENIYYNLALFGTYEKRIEVYRRGLEVFPNSINLRRELGKNLSDIGEYSDAIEVYQRALLIEPNHLNLLQEIVANYQNLLRFEESLSFLHRILTIEPEDFAANEKAGFAYFHLGKFDEAEGYLKKSISTSTASASAWEFWGDIYQQKGDIDVAVQAWKKALPKSYDASQIERIQAKLESYLE